MNGSAPVKVVLGTAQFGNGYGLSDCRLDTHEAMRIVATAHEHGIRDVDTAPCYGDAERRLRDLLANRRDWRVHTKLPSYVRRPDGVSPRDHVLESLDASRRRLGREVLDTWLIHDCDDLAHPAVEEIVDTMRECRDRGDVVAIGASVYNSLDVGAALSVGADDVIQLPLSAFDQRAMREGTLRTLAAHGVTTEIRSVLLQGLLAMPPASLPERFRPHADHLQRFQAAAVEHGLLPAQLAFAFACSAPHVERVVLGVDRAEQLESVLGRRGHRLDLGGAAAWASGEDDLIDPRTWERS